MLIFTEWTVPKIQSRPLLTPQALEAFVLTMGLPMLLHLPDHSGGNAMAVTEAFITFAAGL